MVKKFVSLLSAEALNYKQVIEDFERKGFDGFHFDIMDGHFVKNFAFNSNIIKSLRKITKLPFQAHLEIENPGEYIDMFIDCGCDMITIHPQTCKPEKELRYIKSRGVIASVAVDPDIDINFIKDYFGLIDDVLVMSVYPGFGGQKFIKSSLKKIKELKRIILKNNLNLSISIDGGVSDLNYKSIVNSEADILIYGSTLFNE
jgi:ribulose-phosphate 3-epimerase